MLCSYIAAALALVPAVLAQVGTVLDLPQCGQQIILNAIQTTGCPLTDITCICSNEAFVDELVEQIPLVCSAEDIALTADGSAAICIAYGVEVDLPDFTNATSTGATSSGTAAPTGSTTTSATSGTSTAVPTTSSTASASETEASVSETATATESAAAEETGNGAISYTVSLTGLAGAALLGVVAICL